MLFEEWKHPQNCGPKITKEVNFHGKSGNSHTTLTFMAILILLILVFLKRKRKNYLSNVTSYISFA